MKTSNKILLIFFISAIGIFGAAHLALYARLSKGEIIKENGSGSRIVISDNGSAPPILFLNGNLDVSIHSSDSFSMAWEKSIDGNIKWHKAGDSLIVEGSRPGLLNPSDDRAHGLLPALTIHCGRLQHIGLSGCSARIEGTYDSLHIDATHSNIVIQQNVSIGNLYVLLTDRSSIRDEKARIARPEIHYSADSWLDVPGEDLRNSK